jgi:hypothetical protein
MFSRDVFEDSNEELLLQHRGKYAEPKSLTSHRKSFYLWFWVFRGIGL